MNDRILSLLGLCRRAGRLTIGADPVIQSVQSGEACIVLAASDFSQNSKKYVLKALSDYDTQIITLNRTKEQLSRSVGRMCGILSIADKGFSDKIQELILKEKEQEE